MVVAPLHTFHFYRQNRDGTWSHKPGTMKVTDVDADNNKIYIHKSMREATLNWYHHCLNHSGGDRLANTIKQSCYWKGLSNQAKQFV